METETICLGIMTFLKIPTPQIPGDMQQDLTPKRGNSALWLVLQSSVDEGFSFFFSGG